MVGRNIALTLIVAAALGYMVWQYPPVVWTARLQLGQSLAVTAQAKQLVTHGLYSKIRNPIYIFGSCVIAGLILVVARPRWLRIFVLIIPLQLWRAGKEAKVLEGRALGMTPFQKIATFGRTQGCNDTGEVRSPGQPRAAVPT